MAKPRVCILKAHGTNCDSETSYGFKKGGAIPKIVHVNELRSRIFSLKDFQILAIPGGFSYGDDITSGKILALELISYFRDQLEEFARERKPIIGICNGFQVLAQTGLLPFRTLGSVHASLTYNHSGKFECRWVNLLCETSPCVFTAGMEGLTFPLQIAHGEGRFQTTGENLSAIEKQNLVALRYFGSNPNGSINAIAGICDATGLIFGLMPHPERFVEKTQYPNWRREDLEPFGLKIFQNAVAYAA